MAVIVLDVCVLHAADSFACSKEMHKINVCWKVILVFRLPKVKFKAPEQVFVSVK